MKKAITRGSGFTKKRMLRLSDLDLTTSEGREKFNARNPLLGFVRWLDHFEASIKAEAATYPRGAIQMRVILPADTPQDRAFYLGHLLALCRLLRQEIEDGDCMKIAARALILGAAKREAEIREPSEWHLKRALAVIDGTDAGIESNRKRASNKQQIALRLARDRHWPLGTSMAEVIDHVTSQWPADGPKLPSRRSLYNYLAGAVCRD